MADANLHCVVHQDTVHINVSTQILIPFLRPAQGNVFIVTYCAPPLLLHVCTSDLVCLRRIGPAPFLRGGKMDEYTSGPSTFVDIFDSTARSVGDTATDAYDTIMGVAIHARE